jgi:hypothetical protein
MKKLFLLGLFLCTHLACYAQTRYSIETAIGTHSVGLPTTAPPFSRGGFIFQTEAHSRLGSLERTHYFKSGVCVGFYRHRNLKNTLFVLPMISYRWQIGKHFFVEPSLALGYAGSSMRVPTFQLDAQGNIKNKRGEWLSAFLLQPRLRVGGKVHDRVEVFTQYALQAEGIYRLTPVLPLQSLQIGSSYQFSTSK